MCYNLIKKRRIHLLEGDLLFDKYIFDTYQDLIIKTVRGFIFNNKDNTDLSTYMVPEPNGYIEFDDFELYKIYYEVVDNSKLKLEIIVIAVGDHSFERFHCYFLEAYIHALKLYK